MAPAGGALALLNRRKQQSASASPEEDGSGEGETMDLDMKVTTWEDGEWQLTTAGAPEHRDDEMQGNDSHRATRHMAREEENILHHRHPYDPGYHDYDFDHYDGEPER